MGMMHLKVSFVSQRHWHGKRPVKDREVRSGALSRLGKKNMLATIQSQSSEKATDNQSAASGKGKVYGSHSGSTQTMVIFETDFEGKIGGTTLVKLSNVLNKHEAKIPGMADVKQRKREYTSKKLEITEMYRQKYGDKPDGKQADEIQNAIAAYGFEYYSNQIVVTITSDEEFEGSEAMVDKDQNVLGYILTVRSKSVFTWTRPSYDEAYSYVKLSEQERLIKRVVKSMGLRMEYVPGEGTKPGEFRVIGSNGGKPANNYS